jgi:hypothetical protein
MNSKMIAGGIALVFVAMALPSNAYHITENTSVAAGSGLEPQHWGAAIGVDYPTSDPLVNGGPLCNIINMIPDLHPIITEVKAILCTDDPAFEGGDSAFAFTACEANPDSETGDPGNSGQGGLCFMNPGFSGSPCAATGGRSNGAYNAYDGGACKDAEDDEQGIIASPSRQWYQIQMTDEVNAPVPFTAQIGGITCGDGNGDAFVYDEQFAYTIDGGHVTGFPTTAPPPNTYGTYTVAGPNGSIAPLANKCDPYPMSYN